MVAAGDFGVAGGAPFCDDGGFFDGFGGMGWWVGGCSGDGAAWSELVGFC